MNMTVEKNTVVTLDYNVTDPDGALVDAGEDPIVYLHGGYDDVFPMIEEAIHGKKVGESVTVKMQPADAFGEYDAELIQIEPRSSFPKELQVGMQFNEIAALQGVNMEATKSLFRRAVASLQRALEETYA